MKDTLQDPIQKEHPFTPKIEEAIEEQKKPSNKKVKKDYSSDMDYWAKNKNQLNE